MSKTDPFIFNFITGSFGHLNQSFHQMEMDVEKLKKKVQTVISDNKQEQLVRIFDIQEAIIVE